MFRPPGTANTSKSEEVDVGDHALDVLHGYVTLEDLVKSGKGSQKAGHKYKARKPDGKGGWLYDYGDGKGFRGKKQAAPGTKKDVWEDELPPAERAKEKRRRQRKTAVADGKGKGKGKADPWEAEGKEADAASRRRGQRKQAVADGKGKGKPGFAPSKDEFEEWTHRKDAPKGAPQVEAADDQHYGQES